MASSIGKVPNRIMFPVHGWYGAEHWPVGHIVLWYGWRYEVECAPGPKDEYVQCRRPPHLRREDERVGRAAD